MSGAGVQIIAEKDMEPETVFGHPLKRVILEDGRERYQCQDCRFVHSEVGAFEWTGCVGESLDRSEGGASA